MKVSNVSRLVVLAAIVSAPICGCAGSGSPESLPAGASRTADVQRAKATEKVLYAFTDGTDGGGPNGSLVFDGSGNLYGTTHFGGDDSCGGGVGGGCGVVFELTPKKGGWSESALYTFEDEAGGGFPNSGVILDKNGNVYGTASTGGSSNCSIGCGTVYELLKASGWAENVLYTFTGSDGEFPNASLLPAKNGAFYSTTWYGGSSGNGTVFSLTPKGSAWAESVLYSFQGTTDGSAPAGGVVADGAGNLYGTTYKYDGDNDGVAFELRKKSGWKDSVLYSFTDNGGGEDPYAGLTPGPKGTFYGTTIESGPSGGGTAFELKRKGKTWTESVLHAFGASGDGSAPYAGLVADAKGNLYGATVFGGANGQGTIFELSPSKGAKWTETILHSFTGGSDGANPGGTLTYASGKIYGAAGGGGQYGYGVIFEMTP